MQTKNYNTKERGYACEENTKHKLQMTLRKCVRTQPTGAAYFQIKMKQLSMVPHKRQPIMKHARQECILCAANGEQIEAIRGMFRDGENGNALAG